MMSLPDLPDHVILRLAEFTIISTLRSLHTTNKRLYRILTPILHTLAAKTNYAPTALYYAAATGNGNLIHFILKNATNLIIRASVSGKLLHDAVKGPTCAEGLVTLLLDPEQRNKLVIIDNKLYGTPLHWAAKNGSEAVMAGLLKMGASVNVTDRNGGTALAWAAYNGNTSIIQMLLDNGADVMTKDRMGQRPVNYAAAGGKENAAYMLNEAHKLQKAKEEEGKGEKMKKKKDHRPRQSRISIISIGNSI